MDEQKVFGYHDVIAIYDICFKLILKFNFIHLVCFYFVY